MAESDSKQVTRLTVLLERPLSPGGDRLGAILTAVAMVRGVARVEADTGARPEAIAVDRVRQDLSEAFDRALLEVRLSSAGG